jgi:hypothetical protein
MWRLSRDWIAGALLVLVGLLLLAERHAPALVPVIPLAAGVCLLAAGLLVRWPGLLVSAGVLIGVGLGVLVARGSSPEVAASAFLVCIGAGLLMAWLLAVLLRVHELRWRPLLAGLGFVAAGALVYVLGIGPTLLTLTVGWWPVLLIAIGAVLLAGARARARAAHEVDDETARVLMAHVAHDREGSAQTPGGFAHTSGGYAQTPDWAHDQPPPLDPEQQHDAAGDDSETSWDSEAPH